MKVLFFLLLLSPLIYSLATSYHGHKVLRVEPQNEKQIQALKELRKIRALDFWLEPHTLKRNVDIRVPPSHLSQVVSTLNKLGVNWSIFIHDVQSLIEKQLQPPVTAQANFFSTYHNYDDINKWANSFAAQNPNLVKVFSIGKSYEGRDLTVLKITAGTNPKSTGFWIDAAIHAREWITTATVIYMANQLVADYKTNNGSSVQLLDNMEIYVMPIFNVDGYQYTWKTDRMWRKTRSKNEGSDCYGTDPNRNWDWQWGGDGADGDPCSDTFYGASAFSEIEVKTVADFIWNNRKVIRGYINFHSYSQLWMSPWGYTDTLPADYKAQNDLSKQATNALAAVYGTSYTYGPIATTIYPASGNSADWTYGNSSIIYSYGVELRDTGDYGFLLPAKQIIPSGEETYQALLVFAETILKSSEVLSH